MNRHHILLLLALSTVACTPPEEPVAVDPNKEQPHLFDHYRTFRAPGTAEENFQYVQDWFNDTTSLSPMVLDSVNTSTRTVMGHCPADELSYFIRMTIEDEKIMLAVSELRIHSIPPFNDSCWIPCQVPEHETFDQRVARTRKLAKWKNPLYGARDLAETLAIRYKRFLMGEPEKPRYPDMDRR